MRIKRAKRFMAFLTAAVLTASTMTVNVFADEADNTDSEYSYTDPYVLAFMGSKVPDEYRAYQSFWFSPHQSTFRNVENEEDVTTPWSNILLLYNTEAQKPIPAYCLDMVVDGERGYDYRRLNLEDSGYYSVSDAGRLRAIMNNSFPVNKEASVIENAANEWLEENEMGEITNLTGAEVLSATQYAIWSLANAGDGYLDNTPYVGTTLKPSWTYLVMFPGTKGNVTINESNKANSLNDLVDMLEEAQTDDEGNNITASNITLLSEYLLNLEPQAAKDIVISNASFESADITFEKEEDGTYTAKADVKINATINENDELKLTIKYGELSRTVALKAGGAQTITLPGLPAEAKADNLTLEINGYQTAADIFMFDAVENRGSSQTMIAYDDSRLPVHAEIQVGKKERILNIYKYGPKADTDQAGNGTQVEISADKAPVQNVEFSIYWVATKEEAAEMGLDDAKAYYESQNTSALLGKWIATVKTDVAGHALFNFSNEGQPDGVYMVVEQASSAVAEVADPFFVSVPLTNATGDGWLYEIYVYPKNNIVDDVEVDKDVTELGKKEDTADVNEEIKWIISGSIPAGMYDDTESGKVYAQKYTIKDTLDYRLTYIDDSLTVKLSDKAGEEVELNDTEDYVLTVNDVKDSEKNDTKQLVVTLTEAGIAKVVANLGTGEETPEIRVQFNAVINTVAGEEVLGEEIYNDATVEYTNYSGWSYSSNVEDLPHVHTGGLNILKYDVTDESKLLEGAQFKIARKADENDAEEDIKTLVVNGTTESVVYVDFYTTKNMNGQKADVVSTDENGKAVMYGLAYGEYYLVETKAPAGYNLLSSPVTVTIDADSHTDDKVMKVANSNRFQLPSTGGMGTTIFTVSGMMMLAAAAFVLVMKKKESEEA